MEAAATPVKQSEVVIPETVRYSPDTPASRATMRRGVEYRYLPIINIEDEANPHMTGEKGIISEVDLKLKEGAANLDYFLAYIYVNQGNAEFMEKLLAYFKEVLDWISLKDDDLEIINYDEVNATLRRTNPDPGDYGKLRHTMTEYYVQFDTEWSRGSLGNILWDNLEVTKPADGGLQARALDFGGGQGGGKPKRNKSKKSKKKKSKRKKSKKKKSKRKKSFKRFSLK